MTDPTAAPPPVPVFALNTWADGEVTHHEAPTEETP